MTQCWEEGVLDDSIQYRIINKLDNRAVQLDSATGAVKMMTKDDSSMWQKWMLKVNADGVSGQFVSVGNNKAQLRFERHLRVHKWFLNTWDEQTMLEACVYIKYSRTSLKSSL